MERGHAVHFRCDREDVRGLRVDLMSRMRGVDSFGALWERRTTLRLPSPDSDATDVDLLSLPDLVAAKKTQRDKDWPMIRRLVEANYHEFRGSANDARIRFWLRELRTPEMLIECAAVFPDAVSEIAAERGAVRAAVAGDVAEIERELLTEQTVERERDRAYWAPLRAELEELRRERSGRDG